MSMKKLIIILFIFFLAIACVNASDLNQTDEEASCEVIHHSFSNDILDESSEKIYDENISSDDQYNHDRSWYYDEDARNFAYEIIKNYTNGSRPVVQDDSHYDINDDSPEFKEVYDWLVNYWESCRNNRSQSDDTFFNDSEWDSDEINDLANEIYEYHHLRTNSSNASLMADDLVKYYGDDKYFTVNITNPNDFWNEVCFYVNGSMYSSGIYNTKAGVIFTLNPGKYLITTSVPNMNCSINNTLTVLSTIQSKDLVKYYKDASKFEVNISDVNSSMPENVTFEINGVSYLRPCSNGIAAIGINLDPGRYSITTTNPINGEKKTNNITVLSYIESGDLVKYYRNDSQFVVRVLNRTSGSVTFNINGVFYTRQINQTGHAKLNINLNPGRYIITTICGDYVNSNNITVLSKLYANDLEMYQRDGSQFLVKLLDDNGNRLSGKNVTFNINGVFYNRLTDSNGIARLNINLDSGNYIITSMYDGLAISNNIKISSEPISDPHQMVSPIVKRAVFNALNDTGIIITSFDSTYEMGYRAHLCDLNGNHVDFLTVTDDGEIKKWNDQFYPEPSSISP